MEDNLWWETTFGGRRLSVEDNQRKTTFGGRQPSVEDDLLVEGDLLWILKILEIFSTYLVLIQHYLN